MTEIEVTDCLDCIKWKDAKGCTDPRLLSKFIQFGCRFWKRKSDEEKVLFD